MNKVIAALGIMLCVSGCFDVDSLGGADLSMVDAGTMDTESNDLLSSDVMTDYKYAAMILSQSSIGQMRTGETKSFSITVKNVGTMNWDSLTSIGTTQPADRASEFFVNGEWANVDRPMRLPNGVIIPPGQNYTFTYNMLAPLVQMPTTYNEHFAFLQEGVEWFANGAAEYAVSILVTP